MFPLIVFNRCEEYMAYEIESVNGCTKKFKFNFESVDLSAEIDQALAKKREGVNLKGFRKGKAPLDMVKKLYGPQVENEALYQFVSKEYFEAVQKEGLKAVGYPSFGKTEYKSDVNSVSFEATVEIFPEFELKDYKNYKFTKDKVEVTDKDVADIKNNYLASKAEMIAIEEKGKALENGLFAVMNFEGEKEDGSKPENMAGKEFLLEIGSNQFIPGFEAQMIGMKAGDKKTIEVTFPEEYQEESLKGKPAKFHVELLEIKEKKMPELTDEMAKEFGYESAEDMDAKLKSSVEYQKNREAQEKLQSEILNKFIEENKFDVPQALIDQQKEAIKKDLSGNLKQQGFTDEMCEQYFSKWTEDLDQKGAFQVRSGLILDKIARDFGIEATDADLDEKLEEIAAQSKMEKAQLETYYKGNVNLKQNMLYVIREEKTFEKLISEMKVS